MYAYVSKRVPRAEYCTARECANPKTREATWLPYTW